MRHPSPLPAVPPAALLPLLGCLLVLSTAPGCGHGQPVSDTTFRTKADALRAGTPGSRVVEALGDPDAKSTGVVAVAPAAGSAAPAVPAGDSYPALELARRLPAGTRYEDWLYRRGDTHFHVYMVRSATRPGEWEVAYVHANPAAAAP